MNFGTTRRAPRARRQLSTRVSVVHARGLWGTACLGLALALGQVGGYAHVLTHLQDLAGDKTAPHSNICPLDAAYAQIAGGLADTALPVPVCANSSSAPPTAPQFTFRTARSFLPFARAPPAQS